MNTKRLIAICAVGIVGLLSGCVSARYVERNPDSGIVAVADNTNQWPSYNRDKAMELIRNHVGPDFEIVKEEEVVTGKVTRNDQPVSQVPVWNPIVEDVTAWFIHYRRRPTDPNAPRMEVGFRSNPATRNGVEQASANGPPLPSLLPAGN